MEKLGKGTRGGHGIYLNTELRLHNWGIMTSDQSMNAVGPEKRKTNTSNIRRGGREPKFVNLLSFPNRETIHNI